VDNYPDRGGSLDVCIKVPERRVDAKIRVVDPRGEGKLPGSQEEPIVPPDPPKNDDYVYRGDRNPYSKNSQTRGNKKAHVDANGDLVAANSKGKTTIIEHLIGRKNHLSKSSYISFSTVESKAQTFGKKPPFKVNISALRRDNPKGVTIYATEELLAILETELKKVRKLARRDPGRFNPQIKKIEQAMKNVNKNNEILIQGKIPSKYIEGLPER